LLAPLVRKARTHRKFVRYRDDVVGRRFGIVCIRRPAQTALKCFGDPGYAGAEFKVDRLLEQFGVFDETQTKHKVGTTSARVNSGYSSEILNDELSQARIGMAFAANGGADGSTEFTYSADASS
jgi:hypothetical protein